MTVQTDFVGSSVPGETATSTPRAAKAQTLTNRSAVKAHALKISMESRAGKFTRVSGEFLNDIEAAVDAKLREFRRTVTSRVGTEIPPDDFLRFLSARGKKLLLESFNRWVAEAIHSQTKAVNNGKTF